MAGLNRKVLNSRRITKIMTPSNPVFSRSFITSFDVDFYRRRSGELDSTSFPPLFSLKKTTAFLPFAGNSVNLQRKNQSKQYKIMKAYLYKEEEQPIEPIDEHKLAIADQKPEKPDVPKLTLYVVKYKPLMAATFIALVIFVIWALATWLLN